MEKQGLNLNDISQVLQITDLDGAYIADSAIHVVPEDERMEIPTYLPEGIYAKKSSQIAKRNARKRENIGFLLQQNFILTDEIPYALGYMSHNTECVFLGSGCLPKSSKMTLAKAKRAEWKEYPNGFSEILREFDHGCRSFEEAWKYVMTDLNSLRRGTNLRFLLPNAWETRLCKASLRKQADQNTNS